MRQDDTFRVAFKGVVLRRECFFHRRVIGTVSAAYDKKLLRRFMIDEIIMQRSRRTAVPAMKRKGFIIPDRFLKRRIFHRIDTVPHTEKLFLPALRAGDFLHL